MLVHTNVEWILGTLLILYFNTKPYALVHFGSCGVYSFESLHRFMEADKPRRLRHYNPELWFNAVFIYASTEKPQLDTKRLSVERMRGVYHCSWIVVWFQTDSKPGADMVKTGSTYLCRGQWASGSAGSLLHSGCTWYQSRRLYRDIVLWFGYRFCQQHPRDGNHML